MGKLSAQLDAISFEASFIHSNNASFHLNLRHLHLNTENQRKRAWKIVYENHFHMDKFKHCNKRKAKFNYSFWYWFRFRFKRRLKLMLLNFIKATAKFMYLFKIKINRLNLRQFIQKINPKFLRTFSCCWRFDVRNITNRKHCSCSSDLHHFGVYINN